MLIKANGRQQRQQISNRVVHISVQLLSPESLATKMVREDHLMYIMLTSLKYMMALVLTGVDSMYAHINHELSCGLQFYCIPRTNVRTGDTMV